MYRRTFLILMIECCDCNKKQSTKSIQIYWQNKKFSVSIGKGILFTLSIIVSSNVIDSACLNLATDITV